MQDLMYYIFCAMCLGGGLGVILMPSGYVNSAMSMLVSMLGVAGLLLLMKAYFLAFIMVMVYAGAVLVLFVFVVMLIGDKRDGVSIVKKAMLLALWVALGVVIGLFTPEIFAGAESEKLNALSNAPSTMALAKNYGTSLFTTFMLPFQVAGALLLAAMVGVLAIAKPKTYKRGRSSDMV